MMQTDHQDLSALVKEVRRQLSLSQEGLARELGVSFATVNRWENNHVKPSKLARAQLDAFCLKNDQSGETELLNLTDYQAKYFAHELTRRFPPDSVEKVTVAFAGAQVDLNPHQIDAALFAFKSPLSRGALLADEVGLGKTIEAGLVLSQKWAERKRRILIITPASLRKQWYQELAKKFFLPCRLLESKSYNAAVKQGEVRPFEAPEITICSYHFAKGKADDVKAIPWDLVVIDGAAVCERIGKPDGAACRRAIPTPPGAGWEICGRTPRRLNKFGWRSKNGTASNERSSAARNARRI